MREHLHPEPHRRIGRVGALEQLDLGRMIVRIGMLLADVDDPRRAQLLVEVAIGELVARVDVDHTMRQRDRLLGAAHAVTRLLLLGGRRTCRRRGRRRVRAADHDAAGERHEQVSHRASISAISLILRAMQLLTRDLPGTGGLHKATPEDFIVDELPAYSPSGEGSHTFVRVEKRGLTTAEAVARLCRALDVSPRDAGAAGQKDWQALTRQWISLPDVDPARALAATADGVRVLEAARHGNKLRTGHLAGNRFTLTLRGVAADGLARARVIIDRLVNHGLANYFGPQRFGARGDNAVRGKALLSTEEGRASTRTNGACW